jgi:hypothetical protein
LLVAVAGLNTASIDGGRYLAPVTAAALSCGAALLVPRLRRPVAPLLVTVATAWWGWPLLPLLAVVLFDLAVDRRARTAVGCAVAALGANLLSYPATALWTAQQYASTVLLPLLAVAVGLWLGNRRRSASSELAPVVREVQELVDEARSAGQHIELTADGLAEQAPTTHRLAVYRIVQEALTNARKHAGGAEVTVRIDYRPPATLVEVANTPGTRGTPGTSTVDSGYGLIGLRERVTTLGGHLNAGPAGAGAWRLAARIPHPTGIGQNGTRT